MIRNLTVPEPADHRTLEDMAAELARLMARVRQMASATRALHRVNATLVAANTDLGHDRDDALAETLDAQTEAADIRTRNLALHHASDALGSRTVDLEAAVAEVERTNTTLQAHRVALHELTAILGAARAQLAVILAGIEEAVLVVDHTGAPLRVNAAYTRLFGNAAVVLDDERGNPLAPDQTPWACAARGETFSLSFSLPTGLPSLVGEDTRRWFVATGQPLLEGGVLHSIVVIRDVTLSNRHRRLQEEFLILAAHELRTPLTSVRGYLELLEMLLHEDGDERSHLYATRALHQTQRLVTLVRDLTDVARMQTDRVQLDLSVVDLIPLVAGVTEMAQALPVAHVIRLSLSEAPVWVRGDAARLEQVLFNLLINAVTHAPSMQQIDVRLQRVGDEAVLEVQDYGRGIEADQLPHLFARFYQVPRADRPAQGGLGLGLFICQELIAAHGGHITAVSTVGVGTTFAVRLPLHQCD